ncbi:hypothetical protein BOX15_Mlig020101g2 [Macrostomum lignano]|uniref:Uncharacterized protein n=1 Tax=Macrostomum lignano TaxID=282301 RepID=A0A267HAH0_9PLAT|nr:hypothetical protein BOX15_Mlig020101g2 [Macrostomum lignano]
MTSSILTSSQSGIIGGGGGKVLKTRVQILGRYLLEPGEELSSQLAAQLAHKAKSGRARLRTQLKLFKTGIRLGEAGVFNSMPVEFIEFRRLSDLVSPAQHPSVLVLGVKDYQQRCATVMQFKDDVCLRVVVDVINRHRRLLDEDVARMSDLHSVSSTMRGSAAAGNREGQPMRSSGKRGDGNWRLVGSEPREVASSTASNSMLDDDYAIIRSRMRASVETETANNEEAAPVQQRYEQWQLHHASQDASHHQQHQQRYQKKAAQPHPPHQQVLRYQQQRREIVSVNESMDFDEVETAAIFETPDGPPTLLNELCLRGASSISTGNLENGNHRSGAARISQLPPEFVARARVDRVASSVSSSSGGRPASAAWATLDDRLEE